MDAICSFNIKKCVSNNGKITLDIQKKLHYFYNKTKCNLAVICGKQVILKSELSIVLTKTPGNYKDIIHSYKNILFTEDNNLNEHILLFPNSYKEIHNILNWFFKLFIFKKNKMYKYRNPICKSIWVTQTNKKYGCELFFDYNLEDKFLEEKVFENDNCKIYKYMKL